MTYSVVVLAIFSLSSLNVRKDFFWRSHPTNIIIFISERRGREGEGREGGVGLLRLI